MICAWDLEVCAGARSCAELRCVVNPSSPFQQIDALEQQIVEPASYNCTPSMSANIPNHLQGRV